MSIVLSDLMDTDELQKRIDDGLISARNHPTEPLTIYNYTNKCQYDNAWDEITTQCRGLIIANGGINRSDEVTSRCPNKFFNLVEHLNNPTFKPINEMKPYSVTDKADGSALFSYWEPSTGKIRWATRGSFVSEQAIWANKYWEEHFSNVDLPVEAYTYFCEVIYPENRIVLNYDGKEAIVLIGIIDIATGLQVPQDQLPYPYDEFRNAWPDEIVETFSFSPDLSAANGALPSREKTEGYVILMDDMKTRVKVKEDEYLSLHRIISAVSSTSVWKHLRDGLDIVELADILPDEFYEWIKSQAKSLQDQYDDIYNTAWGEYFEAMDELSEEPIISNRGKFAAIIKTKTYPGLLFSILDGKDIDGKIWLLVEPKRETPFVNS